MKNKILCLLCGMLLAVGLTACGKETTETAVSGTTGKESVKEKTEDGGGLFDNLLEKEVYDLRQNYLCVKEETNRENPEKNKFTFVGPDGLLTITGYEEVEDFISGVAVAETVEGKDVLIDLEGKEIVPAGKYLSIKRLDIDSCYFEVRSKETDKYGLIDGTGHEIIKCEYDSVDVHSNGFRATVFSAEENGIVTAFNYNSVKLIDNILETNFSALGIDLTMDKEGILKVWDNEIMYYFSEKTGELLFTEGKDVEYVDLYSSAGIVKYHDVAQDREVYRLLKEDGTGFVEGVELPRLRMVDIYKLNDKIFVSTDKNISLIYNSQGELIHDFGEKMNCATVGEDKFRFIDAYDESRNCVIYDENYNQVGVINNTSGAFTCDGYFVAYQYEENSDDLGDIKYLYDENGKLLYENVNYSKEYAGYYNKEGIYKSREVLYFWLEDGTYLFKPQGEMKLLEAGKGEKRPQVFYERILLETEEGAVLRDLNMKEIARFEEAAYFERDFGVIVSGNKYYDLSGKLLFEAEE